MCTLQSCLLLLFFVWFFFNIILVMLLLLPFYSHFRCAFLFSQFDSDLYLSFSGRIKSYSLVFTLNWSYNRQSKMCTKRYSSKRLTSNSNVFQIPTIRVRIDTIVSGQSSSSSLLAFVYIIPFQFQFYNINRRRSTYIHVFNGNHCVNCQKRGKK